MRRTDWLAVTVLLLFAAALRILGISHGGLDSEYFPSFAPYGMVHEQIPIQPDEFLNVALPVEMALRNRFNPEFFYYPSFIINGSFVVNHVTGALAEASLTDRDSWSLRAYAPFSLYVMTRVYSVYGGILMVACAYAISRMISGRFAALLAGMLVAVSYTLVQHAHYGKPGTIAGGWMMVAAWASFAALYSRRRGRREAMYIVAGLFTGLAATTRYNAIAVALVVVPVGLVLLYHWRTWRMAKIVGLAWLLIPLTFIVGSPYTLLDFDHFWRDFTYIFGQYTSTGADVFDYYLVDSWVGLFYMLTYAALFAIGIPAIALAVFSLVVAWQSCRVGFMPRVGWPALPIALLAFMLLAYGLVALRTVRPGHSDALLILILPFLAVLSAIGADWLVKRLPLPARFTMPAVALILILQPLVLSVQVVKMFTQPDTRHLMLSWIHDNIPDGSRFFLNGPYNVPLDAAHYPSDQQFEYYASTLPEGAGYDFMVYSDALAFDVLRSVDIVPAEIIRKQHSYLQRLDGTYRRVAEIHRPTWTGSEAMMNMAAYWHNPTLILYCLNPTSCDVVR